MARALVVEVYRETRCLPPEERYGLQSQIRRSVVSIVANIVEGSVRNGEREYLQFVTTALSSAHECKVLIELCVDLDFLSEKSLEGIFESLDHLIRSLQRLADGIRTPGAESRKPEAIADRADPKAPRAEAG